MAEGILPIFSKTKEQEQDSQSSTTKNLPVFSEEPTTPQEQPTEPSSASGEASTYSPYISTIPEFLKKQEEDPYTKQSNYLVSQAQDKLKESYQTTVSPILDQKYSEAIEVYKPLLEDKKQELINRVNNNELTEEAAQAELDAAYEKANQAAYKKAYFTDEVRDAIKNAQTPIQEKLQKDMASLYKMQRASSQLKLEKEVREAQDKLGAWENIGNMFANEWVKTKMVIPQLFQLQEQITYNLTPAEMEDKKFRISSIIPGMKEAETIWNMGTPEAMSSPQAQASYIKDVQKLEDELQLTKEIIGSIERGDYTGAASALVSSAIPLFGSMIRSRLTKGATMAGETAEPIWRAGVLAEAERTGKSVEEILAENLDDEFTAFTVGVGSSILENYSSKGIANYAKNLPGFKELLSTAVKEEVKKDSYAGLKNFAKEVTTEYIQSGLEAGGTAVEEGGKGLTSMEGLKQFKDGFLDFATSQEGAETIISTAAGMGLFTGGAKGLSTVVDASLKNAKTPTELSTDDINKLLLDPQTAKDELSKAFSAGLISEDVFNRANGTLSEINKIDNSLLADTENRSEVIQLVVERDRLKAMAENVDESQKPIVNEQIKALNEQIAQVSSTKKEQETETKPTVEQYGDKQEVKSQKEKVDVNKALDEQNYYSLREKDLSEQDVDTIIERSKTDNNLKTNLPNVFTKTAYATKDGNVQEKLLNATPQFANLLLNNPNLTESVQSRLLDLDIRNAPSIALNNNLSENIQKRLLDTKDDNVVTLLARNKNLSDGTIKSLTEGSNFTDHVAESLAANPNISNEVSEKVNSKLGDEKFIETVISRLDNDSKLNQYTLDKLNSQKPSDLLKHSIGNNIPKVLPDIYKNLVTEYNSQGNISALYSILHNVNNISENEIASINDPNTREFVSNYKKTQRGTFEEYNKQELSETELTEEQVNLLKEAGVEPIELDGNIFTRVVKADSKSDADNKYNSFDDYFKKDPSERIEGLGEGFNWFGRNMYTSKNPIPNKDYGNYVHILSPTKQNPVLISEVDAYKIINKEGLSVRSPINQIHDVMSKYGVDGIQHVNDNYAIAWLNPAENLTLHSTVEVDKVQQSDYENALNSKYGKESDRVAKMESKEQQQKAPSTTKTKQQQEVVPTFEELGTEGRQEMGQEVQAEPQVTTEESKVEEQKIEKAAKISGVKAKNIKGLYDINRRMFGLDRVKSLAAAVVSDRAIGQMAKRAGISKEEMYAKIQFKKGDESTLPQGVKMQVDAFHGSPYQFDKFTTKAIGTGEGAQAFGWGLYFTDLESIARNYAENLGNIEAKVYANGKEIGYGHPLWDYQQFILRANGNVQSVLNELKDIQQVESGFPANARTKARQKAIAFLEKTPKIKIEASRNLYKVSLHKGKTPDQYTWLEWDKPVSNNQIVKIEQALISNNLVGNSKLVGGRYEKDSIRSTNNGVLRVARAGTDTSYSVDLSNKTGEQIYNLIIDIVSKNRFDLKKEYHLQEPAKIASLILLENGIDGIKYPAESISRGATSDTARGSNYVVFDENAISIEEAIKFQKDAQKARGAMVSGMDGSAVIYALTDPNVSTPLHELAHVYEHYLTDQERADILAWTGQKKWDTTTSEKFARGFEKYLADGKAPNTTLQNIFDRFKEWLTEIYEGIKGSDIDLELNTKMKNIYDQMLGDKTETKEKVTPQEVFGKEGLNEYLAAIKEKSREKLDKIVNKYKDRLSKKTKDLKDFKERKAFVETFATDLLKDLQKAKVKYIPTAKVRTIVNAIKSAKTDNSLETATQKLYDTIRDIALTDEERKIKAQNIRNVRQAKVNSRLGKFGDLAQAYAAVNMKEIPTELLEDYYKVMENLGQKGKFTLDVDLINDFVDKISKIDSQTVTDREVKEQKEPETELAQEVKDNIGTLPDSFSGNKYYTGLLRQLKNIPAEFLERYNKGFLTALNSAIENAKNGVMVGNTVTSVIRDYEGSLDAKDIQDKNIVSKLTEGYKNIQNQFKQKTKLFKKARAKKLKDKIADYYSAYSDMILGTIEGTPIYEAQNNVTAKASAADKAIKDVRSNFNKKLKAALRSRIPRIKRPFQISSDPFTNLSIKIALYQRQLEFESNPNTKGVQSFDELIQNMIDNKASYENATNVSQDFINKIEELYKQNLVDGKLSAKKIWDNLNAQEKDLVNFIRKEIDDRTDRNMFMDIAYRNNPLPYYKNYVPRQGVSESQQVGDIYDALNTSGLTRQSFKPTSSNTRANALEFIKIDPFGSFLNYITQSEYDYHLTPVTSRFSSAMKSLETAKDASDQQKLLAGALLDNMKQLLNTTYNNNNRSVNGSLGDTVGQTILSNIVRNTLIKPWRFIADFIGNNLAVVFKSKSLYQTRGERVTFNSVGALDKIQKEFGSTQTERTGKGFNIEFSDLGVSMDKRYSGRDSDIVGALNNAIKNNYIQDFSKAASTLFYKMTETAAKPLWEASFLREFERITGSKFDSESFVKEDNVYSDANKRAIEKARSYADKQTTSIFNTAQNMERKLKQQQRGFFGGLVSDYMQSFAYNENPALREAFQNMVYKSGADRAKGASDFAILSARAITYQVLNAYMLDIIGGLIATAFGDDEEELDTNAVDEIEKGLASYVLLLALGNKPAYVKAAASLGVNLLHKYFLYDKDKEDREYDAYKDALLFAPDIERGGVTGFLGSLGTLSTELSKVAKSTAKSADKINKLYEKKGEVKLDETIKIMNESKMDYYYYKIITKALGLPQVGVSKLLLEEKEKTYAKPKVFTYQSRE